MDSNYEQRVSLVQIHAKKNRILQMSYWISVFCETSERFRAAKYEGSIYLMNTQYATLVNKTAKIYYKEKGTSGKFSLSV